MNKYNFKTKPGLLIIIFGMLVLISGWGMYIYKKNPSKIKVQLTQLLAHTRYCLGIKPEIAVIPSIKQQPTIIPPKVLKQTDTFGTTTVEVAYPYEEDSSATITISDPTLSNNQLSAFDAVDQLAISKNTYDVLPVIQDDSITFFTLNNLGRASEAQPREIKLTTAKIGKEYPIAITKTLGIFESGSAFNGIYTGIKFIGYVPSKKAALLRSAGGDGCGGWGVLWLINESGRTEEVQRFGGGCMTDSGYRYGGNYNDKLLFAKIIPTTEKEYEQYGEFAKITQVFTIDPETLTKETVPFVSNGEVYDLVNFEGYDPPQNKNSILVTQNNNTLEYDPYTKTFTQYRYD